MRLFFAVLVSDAVRETLAHIQAECRSLAGDNGIKWIAPEHFHYTLKFLGETPETRLPAIMEAAKQVAAQSAPFPLTLAGAGAFPSARQPQIFWIGATEGIPLLTQLAESVEEVMVEVGFPLEGRPFHPHLTLARARSQDGEKALAQALAARTTKQNRADKFGVISVESFVLMQSVLRPDGTRYTVLETFAFPAT